MPSITRSTSEAIRLGDDILITIASVTRGEVVLRLDLPRDVPIQVVDRHGLARNLSKLKTAVQLKSPMIPIESGIDSGA